MQSIDVYPLTLRRKLTFVASPAFSFVQILGPVELYYMNVICSKGQQALKALPLSLIHITRLMKEAVRTTDVVARTGGEEFLVLFPHATLSQAVKLAEKMRKVVEANPFVEGDVNHSITASFGVATALTDTNLHACLKQADDNLYKAKNAGRNRVVE